ncbi:general substrate transporter [Suhomyces tanzawaensis NRRL Y-17324]|uniref:General substrate transporter n=1 Tax=Suhomyces tanzawaensis NRRL Y-17324 TaxID=984487 RepID=A0A1E4SB48_9ASCO|nr:general substrate transporter [Suhomyces tanzawaensis NRRL Y-17324]ODV76721.1 general substrate transporter [Suhomyces tanzawaensis NRRL Y-17324]
MSKEASSNKEVASVQLNLLESQSQESHLKLEDVTPKLDKIWFRYPWLFRLNFHLAGSVLVLVAGGFDGTMMNNLQSLPSWNKYFHNPHGSDLGKLNIGTAIGGLCWMPFAFFLTDILGRKKLIILGNLIIIIGAILQGCATSIAMFIGARFLIGFGGISLAGASPLLAETAYPTQRPALTSFLAASFPLGSFAAALITWGPYNTSMKYNDWSWRLPSLLQVFFPIISTIAVFFGPESPRWLISKGREEEAFKVLTKYHGGGDPDSALVKFELSEIKAAIAMENANTKNKWLEWFRTPANRHRLGIIMGLPVMMQFCGNALISYYLTIILNNIGFTKTTDKLKINIGLTIYGLVWSYVVSSICGRFKRKTLIITSYASMCFFFVIWIVLSALNQQRHFKDKSLGNAIVAIIYLYQGCYHIASPIAVTYAMEILPFTLRGTGIVIYQLFANVAQFFNTYVNPIAMEAIEWRYYIVWCIWLVVQIAIVYFFFPETYGLALEEIAVVFGDEIGDIKEAGHRAVEGGQVFEEKPVVSTEEDVTRTRSKS